MNDLFSLTGKTALITGSASGLGFAMARAMAKAGATIVLNGRNQQALDHARDQVSGADVEVFDALDDNAALEGLARVHQRHGQVDILVNNVGLRDRTGLWTIEPAKAITMMNANLNVPFLLARAVAENLTSADLPGRIINVSSVSALLAAGGDPIYSAGKGALLSLTRAMAVILGPQKINVNAIVPGSFRTAPNIASLDDPKALETLRRRTPLQRPGEPEEIAGAAVFLASEASSYMTGQMLIIDGGRSIQL